jgi:arginyl-tRNA synthetase
MDFELAWGRAIWTAALELWNIDVTEHPYAPVLESPTDPKFGDFTCGVALRLARELKKPPRKIAEELAGKLAALPGAAKIEIAGAGFVNLTAHPAVQASSIEEARRKGARFGRSEAGHDLKVLVEHTSANPTGPLHIAHGRQAAVGDSIARILEHAGYRVGREFYINDTGSQVENLGRSIRWRHLESKGVPFTREDRGLDEEGKPRIWLVAEVGGKKFEFEEKNSYRGDYVREIAKKVVEPATVESCGRLGMEILLGEIRSDLEDFRVTYDLWSSQAALEGSGAVARLVEKLKAMGLTYEKDGALWLRAKDAGDTKDNVLVKQDGQYTYRTPDIAYHVDKYERGWSCLIDLWGPDHHAHIQGMETALKMLGYLPSPDHEFKVLIVQYCRLLKDGQEVKMGKRLASYVTLRELMDEVGVDATRWFFVMRKTDSPLDFDMTLAVQQSADNPVYYVQYAHARIASVFRKAVEKGFLAAEELRDGVATGPFDPEALGEEEILLVRHVRGLGRAVERAAMHLDPSILCVYLYGLAAAYQQYQTAGKKDPSKRILIEDERTRNARLATLAAVKVALRTGMGLLGVEAPDRMERDEVE